MSETQLFFDAIRAGDLAAVRTLLDQDAALLNGKNAQSQSPVLFSIYNRQKEIRDFLVSHGAVLELHEAAAAGHLGARQGTPRERRGSCQELFAGWLSGCGARCGVWKFRSRQIFTCERRRYKRRGNQRQRLQRADRRRHQWPHGNCEVAAGKTVPKPTIATRTIILLFLTPPRTAIWKF